MIAVGVSWVLEVAGSGRAGGSEARGGWEASWVEVVGSWRRGCNGGSGRSQHK